MESRGSVPRVLFLLYLPATWQLNSLESDRLISRVEFKPHETNLQADYFLCCERRLSIMSIVNKFIAGWLTSVTWFDRLSLATNIAIASLY